MAHTSHVRHKELQRVPNGQRGCFFFFQAEDGIRDATVTGKSVDLGGRRIIKKKERPVGREEGHRCARNQYDTLRRRREVQDVMELGAVRAVQTCSFFFSSRRRHTRCYRDWKECRSRWSPYHYKKKTSVAEELLIFAAAPRHYAQLHQ